MIDTHYTDTPPYALIVIFIVAVILTIVWLVIREHKNFDRRCISCDRMRIDKGSHFECVVCDADPDPR